MKVTVMKVKVLCWAFSDASSISTGDPDDLGNGSSFSIGARGEMC